MNLTGVETAAGYVPVTGGMRLGFTPRDGDAAPPELHAGDEVSALTEARLPLVYRDAGAFDRREFLARQDIHVLATLRASTLLEKTRTARPTVGLRIARLRGLLRKRVDEIFPESPQTAAVLRAMLLGDRSFMERTQSVDYQKTGVFHVLVVAGLHVGALTVFLFWVARKLRLPHVAKTLFVLAVLSGYVAVVEQRAPVLRATLMAAIVIVGSYFYRRLDLLNLGALAALILLIANPKFATDTGFLLSFLAIGAIGGLAIPVIQLFLQPVLHALENWRDVTRDAGHTPVMVQFRLDFRDAMGALTRRLAERSAKWAQDLGAKGARLGVRMAELFVLSFLLQLCMLPLMVRDFHRVALLGPLTNLFAVPLTGIIVPFGFATLGLATLLPHIAALVAHPLVWLVLLQQRIVSFFAAIPFASYRVPGPPIWVMTCFFLIAAGIVFQLRAKNEKPRWTWHVLWLMLSASAAIIAIYPFGPAIVANSLEISVLDVAQGDSILVVSPKAAPC
jgi:competence protein ComEC